MKICIVSLCLTYGGAERVAVSWANSLSKLGHDVYMYSDYTREVTYKLEDDVKKVQSIPIISQSNFINKASRYIRSFGEIYRVINEIRPNIVITVNYLFALHLKTCMWFGHRCPILLTDHNSFERPNSAPMSITSRFRKFILSKYFDYMTVLTEADKKICQEKGLKNVSVLNNPLFLEPVTVVPPKKKNILAVGRLDAWHCKGFDILIKAWDSIAHEFPEWTLKIVGAGDNSVIEKVYSLAKQRNQIKICSYTSSIEKYYNESSIFVLSSRYEGWGLVLVEAMSQGCAAIACDYKGRQSEIIQDGYNGLLCEPENVAELSKKLKSLIINDELRTRLQNNAPKSVEQFSELKVGKKLESIINRIVQHD